MQTIGQIAAEKCLQMAERTKNLSEQETEYKPSINMVSKETLKPSINKVYKPSLNNNNLPSNEFARVARQLTLWGVSNSGAVIARENPQLVKQAVDYTLAMPNVKCHKAYFRFMLRKLQSEAC